MLRLNGYSTGCLRQEPRDRRLGGQPVRPDRPLADPLGLRQVLRLHRRRDQPVGAAALRRAEPGRDRRRIPNYHFMTDMTNQAIDWMQSRSRSRRTSRSSCTSRPAPPTRRTTCRRSGSPSTRASSTRAGTSCARRRWRGRSSWASCPPDTKLAPKPEAIKDWDKLTRRREEALRPPDGGLRRLRRVRRPRDRPADRRPSRTTGQLDNTLIFYIVGDNGTSAEGGMNGMFNEMTYFNGVHETVQDMLKHYDDWAARRPIRTMAAGWAVAGDTPFTWTKQVASSYGGTRNGMVDSLAQGHQGARARCARSGTMSSTSRRRSWKRPACPSRRASTGPSRRRSKA